MDAIVTILFLSLYLLIPVLVIYGGYRLVRHAVRVELDEWDRRNRK